MFVVWHLLSSKRESKEAQKSVLNGQEAHSGRGMIEGKLTLTESGLTRAEGDHRQIKIRRGAQWKEEAPQWKP